LILVDFNNISVAAVLATIGGQYGFKDENEATELDFLRHLILTSLLSYRRRYSQDGKMFLCCDAANTWRKDVFPYYKVRRLNKPESTFDWKKFYDNMEILKAEISEHMPYHVIKVPRAEGDDCVAVLAKENALLERVVVVSNDKDFGQLKKYPNLVVYRPIKNEEVKIDDASLYLKEMIICGDRIDDVPNILSDDDVFTIKGKRQKSIMKAKLPNYLKSDYETFAEKDKIERNLNMIDFDRIPDEISDKIKECYKLSLDTKKSNRQKIFNYFNQYRLRKLVESLEEF